MGQPRVWARAIGCCAWAAAGVLALGCVQHPIKDTDNQLPKSTVANPWDAQVHVSGAYASTDTPITIYAVLPDDAAGGGGGGGMTSAGQQLTVLTTVNAVGNAIVSPGLPSYFVWQTQITIPQRFWRRGHSFGYEARLLASAQQPSGMGATQQLLLGTPEHPGSPALCRAFNMDPNAFGSVDVQNQARIACAETPSQEELEFTFQSADFDDSCGTNTKACCDTGVACIGSTTCDMTNNRCKTDPPTAPAPSSSGTHGGVNDAAKCTPGDVQLVTGVRPDACQVGFTVTAAKHCNSSGKFDSVATPVECDETTTNDPGVDCYCSIAGPNCGSGAGQPCDVLTTTGGLPGNCVPGSFCVIDQQRMGYTCAALGQTPTPQCWKPSDLKQTNLGSTGGDSGGSGGGGGSGSGSAAAGKGGA